MSNLMRRRPVVAILAAMAGVLATSAPAFAHAIMSPPVAQANVLQQFTLSVPTEKEGARTTKIVLTVPSGFAVDSYENEPGWKRTVVATGSGDNAVVNTITWSGGHTPTEVDSVFRFNADATTRRDAHVQRAPDYSDGSIVEWPGPRARIRLRRLVRASITRRRRRHDDARRSSRSCSARPGCSSGIGASPAGRARSHDRSRARRPRRAGCSWPLGLVLPAVAGAHAALLHEPRRAAPDRPAAQVALTYSEPIEPRFAIVSVTDADGRQVTTRRAGPRPGRRDPARAARAPRPGWYLVYWRVISADGHPVRGAFTFAVGPWPGPAPQFVIPSLSETAATPRLVGALPRLRRAARGDRALRLPARDRAPAPSPRPGATLRPVDDRGVAALAVALVASHLPRVSTAEFALRSSSTSATSCRSSAPRASAAPSSTSGSSWRCSARAAGRDPHRPARARSSARSPSCSRGGVACAAGAVLPCPASRATPRDVAGGARARSTPSTCSPASLWLGGLVGLSCSPGHPGRRASRALAAVVPRFSRWRSRASS